MNVRPGQHLQALTTRTCVGLLLAAVFLSGQAAWGQAIVSSAGNDGAKGEARAEAGTALPDSPGALVQRASGSPMLDSLDQQSAQGAPLPPCRATAADAAVVGEGALPQPAVACQNPENPLNIVINSTTRVPLTPRQKGKLAAKELFNPFNLLALSFESGISVAHNAHSAYGPGFKGAGRLAGYSFVEDAQGGFFGTFLIPSLFGEDPRYRRDEGASVPRRIRHALMHTIAARSDHGRVIPNYSTLLTYPISAELSNLYVPGLATNASATAQRIGLGLATDPIGNLLAEFLPDLARRIHVRSIFVQQIINQMAAGSNNGN